MPHYNLNVIDTDNRSILSYSQVSSPKQPKRQTQDEYSGLLAMKHESKAKKSNRKLTDPKSGKQSSPKSGTSMESGQKSVAKKSYFSRFSTVSAASTLKSKASSLTNDFQVKEPVIDQSGSTGKSSGSFEDKKSESPMQKKEIKSPVKSKQTRIKTLLPKGKRTSMLPSSKSPVKKPPTTSPMKKQNTTIPLRNKGTLKNPLLRNQTSIKPAKKKPKLPKNDTSAHQVVKSLP